MKRYYLFYFLIFTMACNNASNKEGRNTADTALVDRPSAVDPSQTDGTLLELNQKLLSSIKKKDYRSLANHIHPYLGLRLSPYATIDTNNNVTIMPSDLLKIIKENRTFFWGSYDGTGDPISLNIADYLSQFVYDADFLNAEKVMINQSAAKGNSINNIKSIYPKYDYVENYFSGFNKKYEGMDWRALRLIFKKEGNHYYLVGIVHDQWTI